MNDFFSRIILRANYEKFSIPNSLNNLVNVDSSSGLVKMSASCFSLGTKCSSTMPFITCSLIKWYLMSMCLVMECCTGFSVIAIALVLSQKIGIFSKF